MSSDQPARRVGGLAGCPACVRCVVHGLSAYLENLTTAARSPTARIRLRAGAYHSATALTFCSPRIRNRCRPRLRASEWTHSAVDARCLKIAYSSSVAMCCHHSATAGLTLITRKSRRRRRTSSPDRRTSRSATDNCLEWRGHHSLSRSPFRNDRDQQPLRKSPCARRRPVADWNPAST